MIPRLAVRRTHLRHLVRVEASLGHQLHPNVVRLTLHLAISNISSVQQWRAKGHGDGFGEQ